MATLNIIHTGIDGATIEMQPLIGDVNGAVLHMLPGGIKNTEGFQEDIRDIYATTVIGRGTIRGGHYHPILKELFFTVSGTALWILSDFRELSPTYQRTVGIVTGIDEIETPNNFSTFYITRDKALSRLRIPNGVYHAFTPLTNERVMKIAIGSTPYDKNDYVMKSPQEVPDMLEILKSFNITPTS